MPWGCFPHGPQGRGRHGGPAGPTNLRLALVVQLQALLRQAVGDARLSQLHVLADLIDVLGTRPCTAAGAAPRRVPWSARSQARAPHDRRAPAGGARGSSRRTALLQAWRNRICAAPEASCAGRGRRAGEQGRDPGGRTAQRLPAAWAALHKCSPPPSGSMSSSFSTVASGAKSMSFTCLGAGLGFLGAAAVKGCLSPAAGTGAGAGASCAAAAAVASPLALAVPLPPASPRGGAGSLSAAASWARTAVTASRQTAAARRNAARPCEPGGSACAHRPGHGRPSGGRGGRARAPAIHASLAQRIANGLAGLGGLARSVPTLSIAIGQEDQERRAGRGCRLVGQSKSLPAGSNGAHGRPESTVRATCLQRVHDHPHTMWLVGAATLCGRLGQLRAGRSWVDCGGRPGRRRQAEEVGQRVDACLPAGKPSWRASAGGAGRRCVCSTMHAVWLQAAGCQPRQPRGTVKGKCQWQQERVEPSWKFWQGRSEIWRGFGGSEGGVNMRMANMARPARREGRRRV